LITRQGGGGALFASDVFIEDRVAAGLVAGEDVLVATAVDLMMARDCQGIQLPLCFVRFLPAFLCSICWNVLQSFFTLSVSIPSFGFTSYPR
jgi:hypothetical protein